MNSHGVQQLAQRDEEREIKVARERGLDRLSQLPADRFTLWNLGGHLSHETVQICIRMCVLHLVYQVPQKFASILCSCI